MAERTECNFEEMKAIYARLDAEAEAISQLYSQTCGKVDDLHGKGFIGDAADAFFKEMHDLLLPSIDRLATALHQASAASREITVIYRQAEEEAKTGFNSVSF